MGVKTKISNYGANLSKKLKHSAVKGQKLVRDIAIVAKPGSSKKEKKRATKRIKTTGKEVASGARTVVAKAAGEVVGACVPYPYLSGAASTATENMVYTLTGAKSEAHDQGESITESTVENGISGAAGGVVEEVVRDVIPLPVVNRAAGKVAGSITDIAVSRGLDWAQEKAVNGNLLKLAA